jgi:hypothetical protein
LALAPVRESLGAALRPVHQTIEASFPGGLTIEETTEVMGVSLVSVARLTASRGHGSAAKMKLLSRSLFGLFIFTLPFMAAVPAVAQSRRPRPAAVQVMEATFALNSRWLRRPP